MPHTHNRAAFRAAAASNLPSLIRAYCGLVLLELAIKERLGPPNHGHDLPVMLLRLAQQNRPQSAALNQQRSDLTNKLSLLYATRIDDSAGPVRASAYPDLRYLRHVTDWNANASNDQQIEDLRICVDRLRSYLKTNVGFSQPI